MELFGYFTDRIAEIATRRTSLQHRYRLPRSPRHYANQVTFVETAEGRQAMVDLARQLPLAHIGIDTEYQFERPGVVVKKGDVAYDPRGVRPLLLAVVLVAANGTPQEQLGGKLYPFVIDFRIPELLPAVTTLLRLPVCFVGHVLHAELLCLFRHGLPEPTILWDTWVCEKSFHLGRFHKKYDAKRLGQGEADTADEASASEEAQEDDEFRNGLLATCQRYGVEHPHAGDKERLQRSFLSHPASAPFSQEQIDYAAADALATAELYPLQVQAAVQGGVLHHLTTVEMPWVVTNAHMVWHGVRVDGEKCQLIRETCDRHLDALKPQLKQYGINNVRSHPQLKRFFGNTGLLDLFQRKGKVSFEKDALEEFADRHPAINLIRATKKVLQLQADKLLTGEFVGADGRVHPRHRQLGADTGRQSCSAPNILGLGRIFRPLIVPEEGYGIGEVDLSQIEIGLAGAVYHDERLIEMFNTGDVYCNMVRYFYRYLLTAEDLQLPDGAFKKKFDHLRNRMKRCTLGIIYGLSPYGLALYLGISKAEAAVLLDQFIDMFPALKQALLDTWTFGGRCGYVSTVSGLRRYRAQANRPVSTWERNWMTNHPVQGSAAVVFKVAGNRLDKLYRQHDARLIVALHDAYVFEAPLPVLGTVADLTERVMCEAVQEYFPCLRPRAEQNMEHPECWNKNVNSIEKWLQDPTYRIG